MRILGIIFVFLFQVLLSLSKEQLISQEFTNSSFDITQTASWNINTTYPCTVLSKRLIDYGNRTFLGKLFYNQSSNKTFTSLPPHWSLSVRFDIIMVNILMWNGDFFRIFLDSDLQGQYSYQNNGAQIICSKADNLFLFNKNLTNHTTDSLTVEINANNVQNISGNGIVMRNFFLYVDTCDISCATCNGPTNTNCLTCPDFSTQNGTSCSCNSNYVSYFFTCLLQCPPGYIKNNSTNYCMVNPCYQNCTTCDSTNQVCTYCSSGYYLYEGSCINACPPSSKLTSPTCVDFSTNLTNPGYLIKNGLTSSTFGESEIKSYGITVAGFVGFNGKIDSTALTTQCGISYHLLGGPFLSGTGSSISMSFSRLDPHWSARIGYFLMQLDSPDNSQSFLTVDSQLLFASVYNTSFGQQICGNTGNDYSFSIDANFTHNSSSMSIQITNNFNLSVYQSSYGIKDLYILIDYCPANCSICDASGCTTCQANFYLLNQRCFDSCPNGYYQSGSVCGQCDSTCSTCSGGTDSDCLTCVAPYQFFFEHRCLVGCQNGFSVSASNTCDFCIKFSTHGCQSCYPTCQICSPFKVSADSNKCVLCYPSRQYSSGSCNCRDEEDVRMTFYECSYQDQAVLDILLSNLIPILSINFGKMLSDLSGFASQTNSQAICAQIFQTASLTLLGSSSTCQITDQFIKVTLGDTSQVYDGDFLELIPGVLTFSKDPLIKINTFLNNVVIQEDPLGTQVEYTYNQEGDSCLDYTISLKRISQDSSRGFKTITWTLLNYDSSNSVDVAISQLISSANSQQLINFILPIGTLPLETTKSIQVSYLLKNTYSNSQVFSFKLVAIPYFKAQLINNKPSPFFSFNSFDVQTNYYLISCDMFGNPIILLPKNADILVSSPQASSISISSIDNSNSFFTFTVPQYVLQPSINYTFNINVKVSNDSSMFSDQVLSVYVTPSPLIVRIDGGNHLVDYRKQLNCTATIRDLDIQNSADNQLITTSWSCVNPADQSSCKDKNGNALSFSSGTQVSIPKRTFNPYSFIQLNLLGSKNSRSASSSIYVIFDEFDLPPVTTIISVIDSFSQIINLDEEVFVTLQYDSSVNTDILSYSGTLTYNDTTVGIISFDYVSLRFRLWDIYSGFDRTILPLEIRFSVYNPNFFMPSIAIIQFTLNFPPNNCVFSYTKDTAQPIALTTIFTLSMSGCQDADSPIAYQFFFYSSQTEYDQERIIPQVVKRKQITDRQSISSTSTVLPSGAIIILAQAIDSKQAIFNSTLSIYVNDISLAEFDYQLLILQFLSISGKATGQYISQLSILAQDLSHKSSFNSAAIISKKIQIISALQASVALLSPSSQFSSVSDKAVNSLISSGISYSQYQQQSTLQSMKDTLTAILPSQFTTIQREIRKLQLTDYFFTIHSLSDNSYLNSTSAISQLQLDVLEQIGDLLNSNSLPNESQFQIDQNSLVLSSQVITEKNLCAYYKCTQKDFFDSQTNQSTRQPTIYTFQFQQFKEDPFYQDSTLQKYIDTLRQYTNDTLVKYPIIKPLIKSAGAVVRVNQSLNLDYIEQSSSAQPVSSVKTTNLTCISKMTTGWNTSNCHQDYSSKQKLFSCICQEAYPTTIVDDLENLIINKNLQAAFSGQGLSNISNWTNFYCYVAFWLLLTKTTAFITLLIKGRNMDLDNVKLFGQQASAKVSPVQQDKVFESQGDDEKQLKPQKWKRILKQIPNESEMNTFPEIICAQEKKTPKMKIIFNKKTTLVQKIVFSPLTQDQKQPFSKSHEDVQLSEHSQKCKDSNQNIIELQSARHDEEKKQSPKDQQAQISKEQVDRFKLIDKFRQVLYFHNFFNIFLIYDPQMSRPYRFVTFYLRMIHSLAIGIVYSSQYSQLEMIILSIVNSIIIAVALKIFELLSNIRRVGKKISSIFLMTLLIFYYYLILSIVSGQDYSESNEAMTSYLIVFVTDLLIVAVIISIIFRYLAIYVLQYWKMIKCWKQLFDFLRLQLILNEVMRQ